MNVTEALGFDPDQGELDAFRAGYAWGYVHADNGSPGESADRDAAFVLWVNSGEVPE